MKCGAASTIGRACAREGGHAGEHLNDSLRWPNTGSGATVLVPVGDALSFAAAASTLAGELYDKAYRRGRASADADLATAAVHLAELLAAPAPGDAWEARLKARDWLREYAARGVR